MKTNYMANKMILKFFFITLSSSFFACGSGHLRGDSLKSPDSKTYLIVNDDDGGQCGVYWWMARNGHIVLVKKER
jgi:hypothetical protein